MSFKEVLDGTVIPRSITHNVINHYPRDFHRILVLFKANNLTTYLEIYQDWYTGQKDGLDRYETSAHYIFPALIMGGKEMPHGRLAKSLLNIYIQYVQAMSSVTFSFIPWMQVFDFSSDSVEKSMIAFTVDVPMGLVECITMAI